ncbi:MAG: aminotransferase class I/II-fold pyridoxal phosphate-dependent enzyme, partial [Candidatus Omnitrophota bacterium]
GIDVVGFGAGEPDFDTPEHIKDAAKKALDEGFTKYTPASGILELKKAICKKFRTDNNLDYLPEEILVSCGAKHSIFNAILALCNEGDEVILPSPYWVSYPEMIKVAGAKAAIDAGVDAYINTTVNGIGERAGNADLVSVILAIKYSSGFKDKYTLDERVDLSRSWRIAKYASYAFGIPLPINQPGVGANAFAHESGIHADGALKDRRNYELYDFEELGRGEPEIIETGRQITAGEYSGIKGFRNVYERLEIKFHDEKEATEILELVRYANVQTQKPLVEDELRFIAKYPEIARKIFTMAP